MILSDKKLIFVHIPRTGGTIIEKSMTNKFTEKHNYHKHFSAYDYKWAYPEEWESYFKFGFVRNPFDRFISLYHFRPKGLSFSDWLDNITLTYIQQVDYGVDKLDFVGRYENLQKDFNKYFQGKLTMEHTTNHKHYTEYYNDRLIKKVSDLAKDDINQFNYEFGK